MKNKIKIALIGCGHMGRAIITSMNNAAVKSVLKSNHEAFEITASDCDENSLLKVRGLCNVTKSNAQATASAGYVILAVKPQNIEEALTGVDLSKKVVISVMAGLTTERLTELTGSSRIVRVMPNINACVGESLNAYCSCGLNEEELLVVQVILGSFGVCHEVKEENMDSVTGLCGSGPAFVFMTLKAFYNEAIERGFDEAAAKHIAVQTLVGSALTAEKSNESFDTLIKAVCSKGGATARGVEHLDANNYVGVLRGAIAKSIERSKEIGQ